MFTQEITAVIRTDTGKGVARTLRRAGKIPAVLYGSGQEATSLTVDPDAVERLRRLPLGLNTPVELSVDGLAGKRLVMIKELQRHPLSRRLLHVDLVVIDTEAPVVVTVAVHTTGRSIGVQAGGRVNQMRRTIQVRCLPADIPEAIVVDITDFDVNYKLYINDVVLPEGIEVVFDQRFPVIGIAAKGAKSAFDALEVADAEAAAEAGLVDGEAAEDEAEDAEGKQE